MLGLGDAVASAGPYAESAPRSRQITTPAPHHSKQEAQLSPSDRAMRLVSSNLANYHATVNFGSRCLAPTTA